MPKVNEEFPVSEASLRLGLTREQVIRRIQTRVLEGRLDAGRWMVGRESLEQLARERECASPSAA